MKHRYTVFYRQGPDGEAIQEPDMDSWMASYQSIDERRVAATRIDDHVLVSTTFLGIDKNWQAEGPPILWETMVFGGRHDQLTKRYSSREAARQGHDEVVNMLMVDRESGDVGQESRQRLLPDGVGDGEV